MLVVARTGVITWGGLLKNQGQGFRVSGAGGFSNKDSDALGPQIYVSPYLARRNWFGPPPRHRGKIGIYRDPNIAAVV